MGQLRQRGDVWWIRYYRNGKRHEESSRSRKKEDARALLRLREGDVERGLPVTAKIGQLRYNEAETDLINDYTTNKKRSAEHLKRRLRLAVEPWFGGRRMASITTADVRSYIAARQKNTAANATINRELAALKRMFTLALQAGKLLHRPHIPMLQEDNTRKGFFERDQFDSLVKHLPAPLQSIARFAYLSGWRTKSEILPLKWAQVDRNAGIIRLEPGTTKNREGRTFPYKQLPELKDVIEAQWLEHEALKKKNKICPWVFQRKGKQIKSYRRAWLAACTAAACPGRIPHDFRRTAVRNLVRAGVPERVAMQLTGHKTRSVFERYNIVSEGDLEMASSRLAVSRL